MTEIQEFSTHALRSNEYFGFLTKVREAAAYIEAEDEKEAIQSFTDAYDSYEKVMNIDPVNSHTEELQSTSKKINTAWRGLRKQSKVMTTISDEEKKKIAHEATQIIKRYGDITRRGHNDKSASLQNLLQEFEEMPAEKKQTIGIDIWLSELAKNKIAFISSLMAQASEANYRKKGIAKKLRSQVNDAYRFLIKTVNAAALLNGEEEYEKFIGYVNVFIEDARAVLAARKTRAENQREEAAESTEQ